MIKGVRLGLSGDRLRLTGRIPLQSLKDAGIEYDIASSSTGKKSVLVDWTTHNAQILSEIGLPSISRIVTDYSFPMRDGLRPNDYQIQGADFLVRNKRAYMLLDMGLGKTLTSLWAMDYLRLIGQIKQVLVVAPKSILFSSWYSDIKEHLPHLPAVILADSNQSRRKEKMRSEALLHIINHDGVGYFHDILAKNKYDLIIYDESTAIKNHTTMRFRGLRAICGDKVRLWLMTGTPTPQGPMDAYGQIAAMRNVDRKANRIDPSMLGKKNFMPKLSWKQLTMKEVSDYKSVPVKHANEIVHRYMQPAFCRTKDEVMKDSPRTIYMPPVEVDSSPEQKKAYKALKNDELAEGLNGFHVSAINPAVRLSKVLQIAAGCAYAEPFEVGDDDSNKRVVATFPTKAKDQELLQIISQAVGKVIVFVPFTAALHRLYDFLTEKGYKTLLIDGKMKPKEVHVAINHKFQSTAPDSPQVIVAMPTKLSHGITATAATDTVWYTPITRGETYQQANNRMDRIGQKLPSAVHHLSGNSTERRLYKQLQDKTISQRELLEIYKSFLEEK